MARCRVCKKPYEKRGIGQRACSVECSIEWVNRQKAAKLEKLAKLERKETKEKLKSLRPLSYFANIAQKEVNRYVRLKAKIRGEGCYTCDKPASWSGQFHAGHFKSRGSGNHSAIRFSLHNIRNQCSQCNDHFSGRPDVFKENLIRDHGMAYVEALETAGNRRYSREYLERLADVFRRKIKRLEYWQKKNAAC